MRYFWRFFRRVWRMMTMPDHVMGKTSEVPEKATDLRPQHSSQTD